jgi:hypothetical protein
MSVLLEARRCWRTLAGHLASRAIGQKLATRTAPRGEFTVLSVLGTMHIASSSVVREWRTSALAERL